MLDGDEWKREESGIRPTKEDMVLLAREEAEILIQFAYCPYPLQVTVYGVVSGGEVFDMGLHWMNTADIRILHVFPTQEPDPEPIEGVVCPRALADAFVKVNQRLDNIMNGSVPIGDHPKKKDQEDKEDGK